MKSPLDGVQWKGRFRRSFLPRAVVDRPLSLADRLRDRILAEGPMTFASWMEACLYDPTEGYYMRPGRKTGAEDDADFATSPTLHPFLGQAIGAEIVACWRRLQQPAEFAVYEFGGGEGDLERAATPVLETAGCPAPWRHIEVSPTHRAAQDGAAIEQLPAGAVGFVVAHEFLDALPFHILEKRKGNWAEIGVGWDDGFVETHLLPSPKTLEAAPPVVLDEGQRVVAMANARAWTETIGAALSAGDVLVVDYGGSQRMWRDAVGGSVRTFGKHRLGADPWTDPGEQDITANVDFDRLHAWATAAGFDCSIESQEAFLVHHGALEALNAMDRNSREGASNYLRLRQMLIPHAGGMGQTFKVARLRKR